MTEQKELFEDKSINTITIDDEMKSSYIEYAMSVIVGRALPDVRDGLKPVHRRILYSMYNAGFTSGKPYKKCARIVGDVLGRYHPHGDTAVYDSLVRMAQDFSLRYCLVDGQGNFGSVDGDNAAAMRYTEAKMTRISMRILDDIEKDTVDFVDNFDSSLQEPTVLPTRLPNLLLNGSSGIAVGMATNIPPHNLNEIMDGLTAYIDNPEIEVDELMTHIKGPDFPTAGLICGREGIDKAYRTGRGSILIRAKTSFEDSKKKGKQAIIVHELPYQVNKSNLIIKIAELVQEKKITDITDLRDESDRKGMRIYIELKRDAIPEVVLNQLYKHTQLQNTFGVNMVALVKGVPRVLTLKKILTHYLEHRKEVVVRRTQYDLNNANARQHILEGLRIALHNIDAVIKLIKESDSPSVAKQGLMTSFSLSEKQSQAILDMKLQRLTGLEQGKIENEFAELVKKIADLEDILANDSRVLSIIKSEHADIKERFGDERRTEIGEPVKSMELEDLIPDEQVAVLISKKGFVKRVQISMFKMQLRGGRGINSMTTRSEDIIDQLIVTRNHDYLLCFTSRGRVFKLKTFTLPEATRQSKGVSLAHFLEFDDKEILTTVIPISTFDTDEYLVMTTLKGVIKKVDIRAFIHFKNRSIAALTLDDGDHLKWVRRTDGERDILLVTSAGMVIRFDEDQIRSMGRTARGVRGIKIKENDTLVNMSTVEKDAKQLLSLITKKGYGKNLKVDEFKRQNRGGIGVMSLRFRKTIKLDSVVDSAVVNLEDEVMFVSQKGTLCRQAVAKISVQRRESQGVRVIKLDDKDTVMSMAKVVANDEEEPPVSD
ncbi:DNA gyrase subunit A [bacterium]|jgi:DNA gyrase subunit A|nr:DNA gyrase subunit A [bacterium]